MAAGGPRIVIEGRGRGVGSVGVERVSSAVHALGVKRAGPASSVALQRF